MVVTLRTTRAGRHALAPDRTGPVALRGVLWLEVTTPRYTQRPFSTGRTPSWITPALQIERVKRLKQGVYDALMANSGDAMRVLGELVKDAETPVSVRADIGRFIYEQLHGKAAGKLNVDAAIGPRAAVASAIILDDGLPQGHQTIDGELADEIDEDDLIGRTRDDL
jgi:hypothetical protein